MSELIHYDAMRQQLAHCVEIDEAADIRDKAAALAAYARQRDDRELEVWTTAIRYRACMRIGELSMDTEKAEANGRGPVSLPAGGKRKADALAEAGISTSTAHRYEQLAGSEAPTLAAREPGQAAGERYLVECRAQGEVPRMDRLRDAVREGMGLPPSEPPPPVPQQSIDAIREMESARAVRWSDALAWLRAAKELPSVEVMFADRYRGYDHAFPQPLAEAEAWLAAFAGRFRNVK